MDARDRLWAGRELGLEIEELKEAKAKAFHNAVNVGSKYKSDKVQMSVRNSSETKNISYSDYGLLLAKRIQELEEYRKQMINAIYTVEQTKLRGILIAYYINCKTWAEVAALANYDVRHILRLHTVALKKVIWN